MQLECPFYHDDGECDLLQTENYMTCNRVNCERDFAACVCREVLDPVMDAMVFRGDVKDFIVWLERCATNAQESVKSGLKRANSLRAMPGKALARADSAEKEAWQDAVRMNTLRSVAHGLRTQILGEEVEEETDEAQ